MYWDVKTVKPLPDFRIYVEVEDGRKGISKCYHSPIMIDWSSCPDVERAPDRVSGAWVFRGTRVPVAALFENLEEDASVHQFIEWFPGVSLSQARHVLEYAARSTLLAA